MVCKQYSIGMFKRFVIFTNLIQPVSTENVLLVRRGDKHTLKKRKLKMLNLLMQFKAFRENLIKLSL